MNQPIVLFPGQGSQVPGMGRDVAEADADAMELWKKAERISSLPLREIFWDGDEAAMSDTRALQPALTVVNCNLWRLLAGKVEPMGAAGHSLGEFSALAAAQALSLDDALAITSLRGRLMAEADPEGRGVMAAIVRLDEDTTAGIVEEAARESGELLLIANYNTPAQFVISGTRAAVDAAAARAKAARGRAIVLKVSGAFHSPMMEEANRELAPVLEKADWREPRFPVWCNFDARPVASGEAAREKLLAQMVSPVRWTDTVRGQYAAGARSWLEIGPKAVLGKMVKACLDGVAAEGEELPAGIVSDLESARSFTL